VSVKLTKTELRAQQYRLNQLEKYLPTLQLKKAMLQAEVNRASVELKELERHLDISVEKVELFAALLTESHAFILFASIKIKDLTKSFENIAGVDVPIYKGIIFVDVEYSFYGTPIWLESAIASVRELIVSIERIAIMQERKQLLAKELRDVSIRVNLFEKIMIPRAREHIKKIKIFLGDQELAAISQAKVSKEKILARKTTIRMDIGSDEVWV
jgi:V/A-type H+-transporting ATPase subunit D